MPCRMVHLSWPVRLSVALFCLWAAVAVVAQANDHSEDPVSVPMVVSMTASWPSCGKYSLMIEHVYRHGPESFSVLSFTQKLIENPETALNEVLSTTLQKEIAKFSQDFQVYCPSVIAQNELRSEQEHPIVIFAPTSSSSSSAASDSGVVCTSVACVEDLVKSVAPCVSSTGLLRPLSRSLLEIDRHSCLKWVVSFDFERILSATNVEAQQVRDLLAMLSTNLPLDSLLWKHHITDPTLQKSKSLENKYLSGFGVELRVKSTEYDASDDRASIDVPRDHTLVHQVYRNQSVLDRYADVGPLNVDKIGPSLDWQKTLEDKLLRWKAAEAIVRSGQQALSVWELVSQNLPLLANAVAEVRPAVSRPKQYGYEYLQQLSRVMGSHGNIRLNGVSLDDVDDHNVFSLFRVLTEEMTLASVLENVGVTSKKHLHDLLNAAVPSGMNLQKPPRFDFRSPFILYLNNLTRDEAYERFPRGIDNIMRTAYGQLPYIRQNVLNAVFYVDPSTASGIQALLTFQRYIQRAYPVRLGVQLIDAAEERGSQESELSLAVRQIMLTTYWKWGPSALFRLTSMLEPTLVFQGGSAKEKIGKVGVTWREFLKEEQAKKKNVRHLNVAYDPMFSRVPFEHLLDVVSSIRRLNFSQVAGDAVRSQPDDIFIHDGITSWLGNSTIDARLRGVPTHGAEEQGTPGMFLNGLYFPQTTAFVDLPQMAFYDVYYLQQVVQRGALTDEVANSGKAEDVILGDDAFPKFSSALFGRHGQALQFVALPDFISSALHWVTSDRDLEADGDDRRWIVAVSDLSKDDGPAFLQEAVGRLLSRLSSDLVQVALIPYCSVASPECDFVVQALTAAAASMSAAELYSYFDDFRGFDVPSSGLESVAQRNLNWAKSIFGASEEHPHVAFLNGRVVRLPSPCKFTRDDFRSLEMIEWTVRGSKLMPTVRSVFPSREDALKRLAVASVMYRSSMSKERSASLLSSVRRNLLQWSTGTSGQEDPLLHLEIVMPDPFSTSSQRWSSLAQLLVDRFGASVRLQFVPPLDSLNPKSVSLYRFSAARPKNQAAPVALFEAVPARTVFSLMMDVPSSWMVFSEEAPADLDNIAVHKLFQPSPPIVAQFELKRLVIMGHCHESSATHGPAPPAGLQLLLKSEDDRKRRLSDTLVMRNFGYFQLQTAPVPAVLRLAPGRSEQLYTISFLSTDPTAVSSSSSSLGIDEERIEWSLVPDSYIPASWIMQVRRRPGTETLNLLDEVSESASASSVSREIEMETDDSPSLFGRLKRTLGLGTDDGTDQEDQFVGLEGQKTLNVFSMASGWMYERLARIMMLSVVKHTQSNVTFWFIEQYLSPQFKSVLPKFAAEYGCHVRFVSYAWPPWLHRQTEKQRTMWAYKILFLDVLFPLDVDRIVVVDADQIARTDLTELVEMDLHGAPYAYTPFCNDKKEMDGYRFWKGGFWAQHLRGKPYHISALYVVDLHRFRSVGAGDLLRHTYEDLSKDPNSLSNLDQDLPNYAQFAVPIHSLPQEWLWCESWCSDRSKSRAKTIDLCNNPMTKENKLVNAKRVIPEWTALDEEQQRVFDRLTAQASSSPVVSSHL